MHSDFLFGGDIKGLREYGAKAADFNPYP